MIRGQVGFQILQLEVVLIVLLGNLNGLLSALDNLVGGARGLARGLNELGEGRRDVQQR